MTKASILIKIEKEIQMKKYFGILIIFMLLLAPTASVFAQAGAPGSATSSAPGTWVSSLNIQNVGTTDATISLVFYDSAGNVITTFPVTPLIHAGASRSLYIPTDVTGLTPGQFSVVASSDTPLKVVVNMSSTTPYTAGAYEGFDSAASATTLYFPGLYNSYFGFSAELVLQNAGTGPSNVSIQFYNQGTGATVGAPYTDTIPASASKVYTLSALTPAVPSGNTNGLLSAVVTSTNSVPMVGIANVWSNVKFGEFATYDGMVGGATTTYLPGLYNAYFNFMSSLTVQNITNIPTTATVTFSNGVTVSHALGAFQAWQWVTTNVAGLPTGNTNGFFSAKVTSSAAGANLVGIVNSEDKVNGSLSSYNSVSAATASVGCPVVMQSYFMWFSAETVQNVGGSPTNITATYPGGLTKTWNNVPVNGSINVIELPTAGTILPNGTTTSVVFSSSNGMPLVAVVNENSNDRYALNHGDYLLSYSCSAQ
jgi:hypothetical protein